MRRRANAVRFCIVAAGIILLVGSAAHHTWAQTPVTPTNEWVNFYGLESTTGGRPLRVGSIVRAYDPDDVLCGIVITSASGKYGLMPVYHDDPLTPEIDEGAEAGDVIRFTINGMPATVLGPDDATWTVNGDVRHVELEAPLGDHVTLLPVVLGH